MIFITLSTLVQFPRKNHGEFSFNPSTGEVAGLWFVWYSYQAGRGRDELDYHDVIQVPPKRKSD